MTDPRLMLELFGEADPVDLYGAENDVPQLPWTNQPIQTPQNLSARIQEWLGAKEPDLGGTAQNILSARFNSDPGTSYGDYAAGIKDSALGKPTLGTELTGTRIGNQLKQIEALQAIDTGAAKAELYRKGGTGTNGATMAIYQELVKNNPGADPNVLMAMAQKGIQGAYLNNGEVQPIPGAPQAAGAMAGGKKSGETTAELNAKSDSAAVSTLPIISQLREFNSKTFSMPYADTAPVRGYTRIFGSAEQQAMQQNMDLLKQARTDLAAPLAKELGVNPTDRDFQATLDRIFDSNASQESRTAQINSLEQRILARKTARSGTAAVQAPPAAPVTNWIVQNGKLVPAQ